MAKIISIANQKGGVGKTTTAVNLSAALGILEKKILVLDCDPQANATSTLGVNLQDVQKGTYQFIEHISEADELIIKDVTTNVDIMPANMDLAAAELELADGSLVDKDKRAYMLMQALKNIRNKYDYIIIDCAPSLGLITINALTASDSVMVPIQCEYLALEGLGKLLSTIKNVQTNYSQQLSIEGLLLTMYDSRLKLSNQVVKEVRTHFQSIVFDTVIHRNIRISESPSFGKSIIDYDSDSKGSVNYINLAYELLNKHKKDNKDSK